MTSRIPLEYDCRRAFSDEVALVHRFGQRTHRVAEPVQKHPLEAVDGSISTILSVVPREWIITGRFKRFSEMQHLVENHHLLFPDGLILVV